MGKPFAVGDIVKWPVRYGRRAKKTCGEEFGTIESIDRELGLMTIYIGIYPNAHGGCKVTYSAKRVNGRWMAHRPYEGYRNPISRANALPTDSVYRQN